MKDFLKQASGLYLLIIWPTLGILATALYGVSGFLNFSPFLVIGLICAIVNLTQSKDNIKGDQNPPGSF